MMSLSAWLAREARLLCEFVFRAWDLFAVPMRKSRLYHELFHRSCQIALVGSDDTFCQPSCKYRFTGTLARLCPHLDMGSCAELRDGFYYRCRHDIYEWRLKHWAVITCTCVFVILAIALAGWLGHKGLAGFLAMRLQDLTEEVSNAGDSPAMSRTQETPSSAAAGDDQERPALLHTVEPVPFGPLPPGYLTRAQPFGPPKPPP